VYFPTDMYTIVKLATVLEEAESLRPGENCEDSIKCDTRPESGRKVKTIDV